MTTTGKPSHALMTLIEQAVSANVAPTQRAMIYNPNRSEPMIRNEQEEKRAERKTAADFRIEQIEKATVNGKSVKVFTAYRLKVYASGQAAWVHHGKFTVPAKTANRDLWRIANEAA